MKIKRKINWIIPICFLMLIWEKYLYVHEWQTIKKKISIICIYMYACLMCTCFYPSTLCLIQHVCKIIIIFITLSFSISFFISYCSLSLFLSAVNALSRSSKKCSESEFYFHDDINHNIQYVRIQHIKKYKTQYNY